MQKMCKKCGVSKDINEFHRSSGYTDGRCSKCKFCANEERAIYVAKNPEKVRQSQRKYEQTSKKRHKYRQAWLKAHDGIWRTYNRSFYQKNTEHCRKQRRDRYEEYRRQAMTMLGGVKCEKCGCDRYELLEINHKNGNGAKELRSKWKTLSNFVRAIVLGKRKTDDLNVLCRPCNAVHYLEMKHGPLPFQIEWRYE